MMKFRFILIFNVVLLFGCKIYKIDNLYGTYSNKLKLNEGCIKLTLEKDSSFVYYAIGGLSESYSNGFYKIKNDTVILYSIKQNIDTLDINYLMFKPKHLFFIKNKIYFDNIELVKNRTVSP